MKTKEITINTAKEWSEAVDGLMHQNTFMRAYLKTTPFDEAEEELYEILAEQITQGQDDTDSFIELDDLYCRFGNDGSIVDNPEREE